MIRRRRFLRGLALAGAAGSLGLRPARVGAGPPPETRRISLVKFPGICLAPQYVAASAVCATEPQRVAQSLVDRGFTKQYAYALQTLKELPYGQWRQYDAEDTVRFFALRLREAGLITSTPQRILAHGTDWRFLDELKTELKG